MASLIPFVSAVHLSIILNFQSPLYVLQGWSEGLFKRSLRLYSSQSSVLLKVTGFDSIREFFSSKLKLCEPQQYNLLTMPWREQCQGDKIAVFLSIYISWTLWKNWKSTVLLKVEKNGSAEILKDRSASRDLTEFHKTMDNSGWRLTFDRKTLFSVWFVLICTRTLTVQGMLTWVSTFAESV